MSSLSPLPPPSPSSFSQIHHSLLATLRPWRQLLDLSAISIPISFSEATFRISQNVYYFRLNYTLITLVVLFLSLLYHPISIVVFLITFVAWLYFYFSRQEPLVLFNWTIDDRLVLVFLGLITAFALFLTHVWLNVVVSVAIGVALVCFHAAIRAPEDADFRESPYGSLLSVVDDNSPRGSYSQV